MALTRIGLLGGMSWQSTAIYYRLLNERVQAAVGGHASAPVTIYSVDFAEIEAAQQIGDWDAQGRLLAAAARGLEHSGVEAVALATNTLHLVSDQITADLSVPFVDLIDVVGEAVQSAGYTSVGLLATGYTMASDLYPSRLAKYGAEVVVPAAEDRAVVHGVIYDELVRGVVTKESRRAYLGVIDRLVADGAQAVLLACTEIGMLLSDGDAPVPLIDTAYVHCDALVDVIVNGVQS